MILRIALIISIVTYLFWGFLPKGSFYVGNALFIFLLCVHLFLSKKDSFTRFCLLSFSFGNLLDELIFDNTVLGVNEIILFVSTPIIWFLIKRFRNGKIFPK